MLRIDPSIALDVELNGNGAGKHAFQPGDPQTGREATQCPSQWLNAVQETLCRAIEDGLGPLDSNNPLQLLELIKKIAWGENQTGAPWLRRYLSGTILPTVYAGDVIYIGTDKYEWIGGAYVRIKPIVAKSQITAINTTASCSVSLSIPKNGILYITGTRNVSAIGPDAQHYSRILLNGVTVALDITLATVTHSLAIYITAGNHTIELVGQHSLSFSLWLSVLYVPN